MQPNSSPTRWRRRGSGAPEPLGGGARSRGHSVAGPETTIAVEKTALAVMLLEPPAGAVVMGEVAVAADAGDEGSGVASVRFEVSPGNDDWSEVATISAAPFRTSWNTGLLGEGDYRLRAIALDRAGNEAISPAVAVRVERVEASVKLEDPGEQLAGTIRLSASVRDEARTAAVEFQVAVADTFAWQPLGRVSQPPFGLEVDTSVLTDGLYDLRSVARDRTGGLDASRILRRRQIDNGASAPLEEEPPEEAGAPVLPASEDEITLGQLERLLEQSGGAYGNREELAALLYTLRPYARPDGTIPARFWPLLREAFGNLLGGS